RWSTPSGRSYPFSPKSLTSPTSSRLSAGFRVARPTMGPYRSLSGRVGSSRSLQPAANGPRSTGKSTGAPPEPPLPGLGTFGWESDDRRNGRQQFIPDTTAPTSGRQSLFPDARTLFVGHYGSISDAKQSIPDQENLIPDREISRSDSGTSVSES